MHELVLCLLLGFALSLPLCAAQIPLLRRAGRGAEYPLLCQRAREEGGNAHDGRAGLYARPRRVRRSSSSAGTAASLPALAVGGGYLLVGLLDDLMKKHRKDNLGLRPYQKICFQLAVALIAAFYCLYAGLTRVYLPFSTRTGRSLVRHRAARGPRLSRDGEQRQSDGRAGRARGVPSRRSFSSFWVHCSRCRAWEAGWKCSPSALPGRLPPILCSTLTAPASLWGTRARSRSGDLRRRSRSFRGTRSFCPFWGRCSLYPAYPSSCRS